MSYTTSANVTMQTSWRLTVPSLYAYVTAYTGGFTTTTKWQWKIFYHGGAYYELIASGICDSAAEANDTMMAECARYERAFGIRDNR